MFANLIETDQVYGHRKDVEGFARALREIDARVARWLGGCASDDLLILTADHGVRPAASRAPTTRASTRRCWRHRRDGARGARRRLRGRATTARWPTSARACCAGWPGATRRELPGRRSVGR